MGHFRLRSRRFRVAFSSNFTMYVDFNFSDGRLRRTRTNTSLGSSRNEYTERSLRPARGPMPLLGTVLARERLGSRSEHVQKKRDQSYRFGTINALMHRRKQYT